ncbi:helix-turn-helix transcriptional regulator [Ruminococcus sp.]|uniref:helix-turn-helix transcriptional regulator n=2 Tax=Ruminococcus TaxID=1263 RepID=UPI00307B6C75
MLSKRIRELRFSLGLNQVQFGQALNVTKQTISNWENDNIQPSVEMLIKIVNTYSVSANITAVPEWKMILKMLSIKTN